MRVNQLIGLLSLAAGLTAAAPVRLEALSAPPRWLREVLPDRWFSHLQQHESDSSGRRRIVPAVGTDSAGGGVTIDLAQFSELGKLEMALRAALADSAPEVRLTIVGGTARFGRFVLGSSESLVGHLVILEGDADIYGEIAGSVVTVDGDIVVHEGAQITGDALALGGRVSLQGGSVGGKARYTGTVAKSDGLSQRPGTLVAFGQRAAGLAGVFLILSFLGILVVAFAKPNIDTVSDTVIHSFGRSFLAGLLGQVLLVPTFGMLVVGMLLTVVGAVLVPFIVVVYALIAVIGIVGGFLAVAHAMGERQTRRRMAQGMAASLNSYRYLLSGLGTAFSVWLAWLVFGWVPVAGLLIFLASVLVTWVMVTVGFGAAILSRAGVKPQFSGRYLSPEAMTDEYLWATPQFGVKAITRPAGYERKSKGGRA